MEGEGWERFLKDLFFFFKVWRGWFEEAEHTTT